MSIRRRERILPWLWHQAGVGTAWAAALRVLPRPAKTWLEGQRARLRAAVPAFQLREKSLYRSFTDALHLLEEEGSPLGAYLEFGVSRGASFSCMHRASRDAGMATMPLIGFDSFAGLPAEAASSDNGVWRPGQFESTASETRAWLSSQGIDWTRSSLVEGWFDETLTSDLKAMEGVDAASIVMIDCDLYSSTKVALEFVAPLIRDRAVLFFDDWKHAALDQRNLGEKKAFDEFLAEHPELVARSLPPYSPESYVCLVSRRENAGPPRR
jgi:O-methyltransferase